VGFLLTDRVVRCCSEGLGFLIPSRFSKRDLRNSDLHFSYCYLRECIEIKLRGAARESGSVVDAFTSEYGVCTSGKSSS
jgi:hypothetical protein